MQLIILGRLEMEFEGWKKGVPKKSRWREGGEKEDKEDLIKR